MVSYEKDPLLPSSSPPHGGNNRSKKIQSRKIPQNLILLFLATATVVVLLNAKLFARLNQSQSPRRTSTFGRISPSALSEGLEKCKVIAETVPGWITAKRSRNPRWMKLAADHASYDCVSITNATIWTGDGEVLYNHNLLISKGLIFKIAKNAQFPKGECKSSFNVEINAYGKVVSPGLVDMHSHMGVDSYPALHATDDTNEMTQPTFPQLKSLDAFNPHDPAIKLILSGGVTTSLVLPGSGNLMGGEAFAFKHFTPMSNSAEDMLLNSNMKSKEDGAQWRWMKMACGENPKNVYGEKGQTPSSRMGSAWLFRERFEEARNEMIKQQDWCSASTALVAQEGEHAHEFVTERYPMAEKHESLIALLRGNVRLNIHCYETHDIEMLLRLSKQFNFTITAFHHALEAYMIADKLAEAQIGAAIFPDNWAYKKEAYDASVHSPEILDKAGVKVAFKSDHPVMNAQYLLNEARKAWHYGYPPEKAFAAVTSVPATLMGVGWRVGSLREGYDADVVVWDRNPFAPAAKPEHIFIDGIQAHATSAEPGFVTPSFGRTPHYPSTVKPLKSICTHVHTMQQVTFVNASKIYVNPGKGTVLNGSIVMRSGMVTCVGDCQPGGEIVDLKGGVVTPGLIGGATRLGLSEISQEDSTQDGNAPNDADADKFINARDGIRIGDSRVIKSAFRNGVTHAISVPMSRNSVLGVSTMIELGIDDISHGVVPRSVAFHYRVGHNSKMPSSPFSSISGQIAELRHILMKQISMTNRGDILHKVVRGEVPLAVEVNNSDDILKVVGVKELVEEHVHNMTGTRPVIKLVIVGGVEAWVVQHHLMDKGISVLLKPARCAPDQWETRRCNVRSPELLASSGIPVALGISDMSFIRNFMFEATEVYHRGSNFVTPSDALAMVTSNVRDMFNTKVGGIIANGEAAFVVYDRDPIVDGLAAQVRAVISGEKVECDPRQV